MIVESLIQDIASARHRHRQGAMANTTVATKMRISKRRMFEEMPPFTTQSMIGKKSTVNITSFKNNDFKRIMASPIQVNTTSEISEPTTFIHSEMYQINNKILDGTIASIEPRTTSGGMNPLVILALVLGGIFVGVIVCSIASCLRGRKENKAAAQAEAEEQRTTRLDRLKHIKVKLKYLEEIMASDRSV